MQTPTTKILAAVLALFAATSAAAQMPSRAEFRTGFSKGFEYEDEKLMDKWMKKPECSVHAALYFEELYVEVWKGHEESRPKCEALKESWHRCFDGSQTLDKLQRWVDAIDTRTYDTLQRGRSMAAKVWQNHLDMPNPSRGELLETAGNFAKLADNARALGHMVEVAELWSLGATVVAKIPAKERTLDDRREIVRMREEFIRARDAWEFTFDGYYTSSVAFLKDEKVRIAADEKEAEKRRAEGYDDNAKGVDAYVVPGAKEDLHELKFIALKDWTKDLDYGPKNGLVPFLWWNTSTRGVGSTGKIAWFQRRDLYVGRAGANKFVITFSDSDVENGFPIHVSTRPKPSAFWLDADKREPYAMWFWSGSDREFIGQAECNLAPSKEFALIYYRSAASWATKVGKENLVFYDDNANGLPCDGNPWEQEFKAYTAGEPDAGTPAPILDSMRIGKSKKRQPFSEFVKLQAGWFHLHRTGDLVIGLRPLNPEYYKTGKAKLQWKGPKSSMPKQLVVQGRGDFATAFFDLADGKEVEMPVGEYRVIFGRVLAGKGARVQNATLYGGESKPFVVEEGKTTVLRMGAPFQIQWTRKGDVNLTIDPLKVFVRESSGCFLTELHGAILAPEVLASKTARTRGAKVVGKFQPFTDGELARIAGNSQPNLSNLTALFPMPQGYRDGAPSLSVKLPAEGMKVGLHQKKHPLFGELQPLWQ